MALAAEHVTPAGECGVNAHLKVPCLVAGMAAGADSIDDMDVLRHGAMDALFGGVRAPSTLGSHLPTMRACRNVFFAKCVHVEFPVMCTSSAVDYFRGARLVGLAVWPGGLLLTMARSLPGFADSWLWSVVVRTGRSAALRLQMMMADPWSASLAACHRVG
jgi:hypothetical protein